MAWKQKLDAEEADIKRMETEALEALSAREAAKVKDKVGKEKEVSFKDEEPKKTKGLYIMTFRSDGCLRRSVFVTVKC